MDNAIEGFKTVTFVAANTMPFWVIGTALVTLIYVATH